MADRLDVWLNDVQVGELIPMRNGARFQYAPDVVHSSPGLPLLSASLPVQGTPFDAERTRSWFAGLLPEDRQREEVARRFNIQGGTYLDMLREIGWECAGAVLIAESGHTPLRGSLTPLTDGALAKRLAALPARPYDDNDAIRVSLGGYQAKLLVATVGDGWALPVGGAVSSHILKPASEQWPQLVEGEAWAMTAAATATSTANVGLLTIPGAPTTLVVDRFDRETRHGVLLRTHQEDAAQAMGVPPERKYATRDGSASDPSLRRIAVLLERYSSDPTAALRQLLEQVVVNVALGNTDAHAKNYGILHPTAQTIELSQMYDVVPAVIVNPATLDMGLRVGDSLRIDRVTVRKLEQEALLWGVKPAISRRVIQTTLDALRAGTVQAGERYPQTAEHVTRYVEERITELQRQLPGSSG